MQTPIQPLTTESDKHDLTSPGGSRDGSVHHTGTEQPGLRALAGRKAPQLSQGSALLRNGAAKKGRYDLEKGRRIHPCRAYNAPRKPRHFPTLKHKNLTWSQSLFHPFAHYLFAYFCPTALSTPTFTPSFHARAPNALFCQRINYRHARTHIQSYAQCSALCRRVV
jgi:hypothetical protein